MQEALESYMDNTTFERPLLSGVAYAERVCHWERENFEGGQLWSIMHRSFESQPLPVQEEHAPVNVCCQTNHINALLNLLDMMTEKEDQDGVLQARGIEKAVLSAPFRLLGSNWIGVILTYPVYRSYLSPSMCMEKYMRAIAGFVFCCSFLQHSLV
ncbi:hypothetical protein BT93_J0222 [Corymbia citriodora subsp. variegata]|nr:hypothetical protein BT93_J0222 [Corymbia citriodora subsp. variegata]